jgi:hypothetical protein
VLAAATSARSTRATSPTARSTRHTRSPRCDPFRIFVMSTAALPLLQWPLAGSGLNCVAVVLCLSVSVALTCVAVVSPLLLWRDPSVGAPARQIRPSRPSRCRLATGGTVILMPSLSFWQKVTAMTASLPCKSRAHRALPGQNTPAQNDSTAAI